MKMSKQQSLKELGSLVSKRTLTRFVTLLKRANTVIKSGKRERVRLNIKSMGKSGLDVEVINDGSANETTKNDLLQQLTKLASNKGLQRLTKVVQKVAKGKSLFGLAEAKNLTIKSESRPIMLLLNIKLVEVMQSFNKH